MPMNASDRLADKAPGLVPTVIHGARVFVLSPGIATALACGLTLITIGCAREVSSAPPDAKTGSGATHSVYVATDGWKGGDGTKERPLDLATALSAGGMPHPGDTVWLRGGTYKGAFDSFLTGTAEAPIIVRPQAGEHVVIDSAPVKDKEPPLAVFGSWTIYRDLEVTSSDSTRSSNTGVVVHGPNTKIVNMVVHDLTGGLAMWSDAVDAEAYGNIIFYNGWLDAASNKAKGHGIYTQNEIGTRRLTDNVIFSQFGAGIHAYGSSDAFLDHFTFEGNIIFNNGILTGAHISNILLGGGRMAKGPVVKSNYSYSSTSGDNNIGYSVGCEDLVMQDNHFAMIGFGFQLVNCSGTIERNTVYGDVRGIEGQTIVNRTEIEKRYPNNSYLERPKTGVETFVRPNQYEPGRAHVVVYNWGKANKVTVDLKAAGLQPGTKFELRDVQNLGAPPIVSGTYSGSAVSIPMAKLTETAPLIGFAPKPPHTAPEFAVFLLTPVPTQPSWFDSALSTIRKVL
jgi:hypothetical protein